MFRANFPKKRRKKTNKQTVIWSQKKSNQSGIVPTPHNVTMITLAHWKFNSNSNNNSSALEQRPNSNQTKTKTKPDRINTFNEQKKRKKICVAEQRAHCIAFLWEIFWARCKRLRFICLRVRCACMYVFLCISTLKAFLL